MSKNIEILETLGSQYKEAVKTLSAAQEEGKIALVRVEDARKSADTALMDSASNEFEAKGEVIRAALKAVNQVKEQMELFQEYEEEPATPAVKSNVSKEDLEELFERYQAKSEGNSAKKTVGEYFADILKSRGRTSFDSLRNGNSVSLDILLGKDDKEAVEEVRKSGKAVKSIYSNNGVELLDVGDVGIPGHVGYQCGLVEDPEVCMLTLPPDEFEDCLTVKTLNGNRLRYTRMISRVDNAGIVPETVYESQNYPDFVQDGTKPEGIFTLATVEVPVSKIAELVVASDEVLDDCPSVASIINDFLITGVEAKKRQQLISGTGSNGQMRGILNQPDILTRTHRSTPNGISSDNIWDTFRRAMTDLYIQGADTSNLCVIMNPSDVEIIDLLKDDNGRYLFSDNNSDCMNRKLRCLNVKQASSITAGTAVIGQLKNNWMFYVRKALQVRVGYTGDQMITNTNTILAEMRGLTTLKCPQHVERITGIAL
jgi:hypothetical protein